LSTSWVGDLRPLDAHTEGNDVTIPDDMKAHNEQLIAQFRAAGRKLENRPLLLLTTTGARSGKPHTAPMMYVRDGDRLLVIASNAGAPRAIPIGTATCWRIQG
jgi:hypothetical protein